jgi:hypothetical protein
MRLLAFALCLALAAFPAAAAESGKKAFGVITVMANVQPSVVVKYEFKALQRRVTAQDIARGYIDLPASALLSVNAGKLAPLIVVDFVPVEGRLKHVEIRSKETKVATSEDLDLLRARLPALGEFGLYKPMAMPGSGASEAVLSYRIHFADQARPGNYSVPLTVNITL